MWSFRLREPNRGDRITADWAREIVRALRSMRLFPGPGIRLSQTPDGTTLSVKGGAGGISAPAKPAEHFGNADNAESRAEWNQTEEVPAVLEIPDADGNVLVKLLIDSRGNVISWTSAGEDGEEPDDPAPPRDPPTCGNPLNDNDDSNPLDGDGGGGSGGGGGGGKPNDRNPLDYEGDGGYTPQCA